MGQEVAYRSNPVKAVTVCYTDCLKPRASALRYFTDGDQQLPRQGAGPEVLQPSRRVDQIHTRSLSRATEESIPLRKPRISRIVRTGTNSIRF